MLLKDMLTRCNQCGYENGPNYRFCGMCGAPLQASEPARAAAPSRTPEKPAPVSGPSFLGLADEPSRNLDYLLEDDEPRSSHWRLYLALIILIVAGAVIGFRWWRYGFPWAGLRPATAQSVQENQQAPPATETTPATEQPAASQPAPTTSAASPSPEAAQSSPPPQPLPSEGTPASSPAPHESEAAKPPETQPEPAAEAPPASQNAPEESAKPEPAKAAPSPSGVDKLVADGEKYLYGNGVPQDCGRALKNISAAAARANVHAQTLLGAMYSTGHCASHDLPTAYKWFARALSNDPGNPRLERDLQMVWNQMTPGEKQIATRSQ